MEKTYPNAAKKGWITIREKKGEKKGKWKRRWIVLLVENDVLKLFHFKKLGQPLVKISNIEEIIPGSFSEEKKFYFILNTTQMAIADENPKKEKRYSIPKESFGEVPCSIELAFTTQVEMDSWMKIGIRLFNKLKNLKKTGGNSPAERKWTARAKNHGFRYESKLQTTSTPSLPTAKETKEEKRSSVLTTNPTSPLPNPPPSPTFPKSPSPNNLTPTSPSPSPTNSSPTNLSPSNLISPSITQKEIEISK